MSARRKALDAARENYQTIVNSFSSEATADGPAAAAERRNEVEQAHEAVLTAQARFQDAMRGYEETPGGQRALSLAAERLTSVGNLSAAKAASDRLDEIRFVRDRQRRALTRMRLELSGLENAAPVKWKAAQEAWIAWAEADINAERMEYRYDHLLDERRSLREIPTQELTPEAQARRATITMQLRQVAAETEDALEQRNLARERFRVASTGARSSAERIARSATRAEANGALEVLRVEGPSTVASTVGVIHL